MTSCPNPIILYPSRLSSSVEAGGDQEINSSFNLTKYLKDCLSLSAFKIHGTLWQKPVVLIVVDKVICLSSLIPLMGSKERNQLLYHVD